MPQVEDQTERQEALLGCLVANDVFRELYERFKDTSSELNIQSHLMKQGFDPAVASSVAGIYKSSVDFALLTATEESEIEE